MLSLQNAISVLCQAAQKGQASGVFRLDEAALIADAIESSAHHVTNVEKEQALREEKINTILQNLTEFKQAVKQIDCIYRDPGMPGSCSDGEREPAEAGCEGDTQWDRILALLEGIRVTSKKVDEILYSPGFPGSLEAEASFRARASGADVPRE
jgi:hypothetical protein